MLQIAHSIFLMAGSILLYHGIVVYRLSRTDRFIPYTGVAAMSFSSALYYLAMASYDLTTDKTATRLLAHLVWIGGPLSIYFNIVSLEAYLAIKSRFLAVAKWIMQSLVGLVAASVITLLSFDQMLIFSPLAMETGPLSLPPHVWDAFSPDYVTIAMILLLLVIEISAFGFFVRLLILRREDRWLIFAQAISLVAILHELYLAITPTSNGLSFFFVANIVEIFRLTDLIRKENRRRLLRMDNSMRLAQLGALTATIAHEIGTPLTSILATTQLGENAVDPGLQHAEKIRSLFDTIGSSTRRISSIAHALKNHARDQLDEVTPFCVNTAIRDALQIVAPLYRRKGIEISTTLSPRMSRVLGDAGKFQQVLINLIHNARDATEGRSSRRINIVADEAGDQIVIRVADNGVGIPKELHSKIFQPFFTTKPAGSGTGIGLSFAANQIHSWKGVIQVDSQEGVGTTFEMSLPALRE